MMWQPIPLEKVAIAIHGYGSLRLTQGECKNADSGVTYTQPHAFLHLTEKEFLKSFTTDDFIFFCI